MATYLSIDDGLKRSLGYLNEDNSLDDDELSLMENALTTAELYVQGAIGTDNEEFYSNERIMPLYTIACNSLAGSYMQNPTSITRGPTVAVDTVCNAIIGQLRGLYDVEVTADDSNDESSSTNSKD